MQPTVPTLWVWKRLSRTHATDLRAHDRVTSRNHPHDLYGYEVFGFRKDYGRSLFMPEPDWLNGRIWKELASSAPATWRDRYRSDTWPPKINQIPSHPMLEPAPVPFPARGAAPAGGAGWSVAARGWAAGAVLLVVLLWMLKFADNCLHKRLFKSIMRRQDSEEWSTPNVTALSYPMQQLDMEVNTLPRPGDTSDLSDATQRSGDLPPPYSECTGVESNNINKYITEEPPPPYSACYETFSPKDLPEVHIQNRRRQNTLDEQAHSSTEMDNVQNDLIENRRRTDTAVSHEQTDTRIELVLENGRILERVVDCNRNDTDMSNTGGGEDRHVSRGRVTFADEETMDVMPERVLLV